MVGVLVDFVQGEMMVAAKEILLPDTMISPETGETLKRDIRPFEVSYRGEKIIVNLPGYYPENDGDGVHVGKDMSVVNNALRELKESIKGVPTPATIRRVRAKLHLSQRGAGAVFKVCKNAFDKYERGLIEPSGPTIQLIKVLDRHPDFVKELR